MALKGTLDTPFKGRNWVLVRLMVFHFKFSHLLQIMVPLKADLHGSTLSHATGLRQAYDMTSDHLYAHDIFTCDMPKSRTIPLRILSRILLKMVLMAGSSSLQYDINFSAAS